MTPLVLAKNILERSQSVLIISPQNLDGDIFGATLALFYTLKKLGKNVNVYLERTPPKFQFLTNFQPNFFKKFIINVDTQGKDISEMYYEKNDQNLKIYLTLSQGEIEKNDISFLNSNPEGTTPPQNPDLLITIGVQSLENLGHFFEENPTLFYETPILNIDNQSNNENFGEVNLVEIKSCSLSEILTKLIRQFDEELIDEDIATPLLAGIIFATQNFQNPRVQPKTFEIASQLIEKGANHQKIVQHLYKMKSISQIKLLGLILKKMNFDEKRDLYSACLNNQDFEEAGAYPKDLGEVLQDLKLTFSSSLFPYSNLLILWEGHSSSSFINGLFYSQKTELIRKIIDNFEGVPKGRGVLFTIKERGLESAKQKFLKLI